MSELLAIGQNNSLLDPVIKDKLTNPNCVSSTHGTVCRRVAWSMSQNTAVRQEDVVLCRAAALVVEIILLEQSQGLKRPPLNRHSSDLSM